MDHRIDPHEIVPFHIPDVHSDLSCHICIFRVKNTVVFVVSGVHAGDTVSPPEKFRGQNPADIPQVTRDKHVAGW
jgi:hypothetical protein